MADMPEVLRSLIDRMNAHDAGGMSALIAEDFLFVDSLGRKVLGRDWFQRAWQQFFVENPHYWIAIHEVIGEGVRLRLTGHSGTAVASKTVGPFGPVTEWIAILSRSVPTTLAMWKVASHEPAGESCAIVDQVSAMKAAIADAEAQAHAKAAEKRSDAIEFVFEEEPWLANPSRGYLLTFTGPKSKRPHPFCGEHAIPGADCPNCESPLTRVVSFQTSQLPFSLGEIRTLHRPRFRFCSAGDVPS